MQLSPRNGSLAKCSCATFVPRSGLTDLPSLICTGTSESGSLLTELPIDRGDSQKMRRKEGIDNGMAPVI